MRKRTILLIHDEDVGWADVRTILLSLPQATIVGEAVTATEASNLASSFRPSMLLLGATIEDESAVPLFRILRSGSCPLSIAAIFAAQLDMGQLAAFVSLNISGYFVWSDIQQSALRPSLEALMTGDLLIGSRSTATSFINWIAQLHDRRNTQLNYTARASSPPRARPGPDSQGDLGSCAPESANH